MFVPDSSVVPSVDSRTASVPTRTGAIARGPTHEPSKVPLRSEGDKSVDSNEDPPAKPLAFFESLEPVPVPVPVDADGERARAGILG